MFYAHHLRHHQHPSPHPYAPKGQVVYALFAAGVIETEKLGS